MLVVGLTGNIGCGKSSLSDIFRAEGIKIIDADIIARQIYEDEKLLSKVYETFGNDIKNEDGSLNRKALGRIVFSDDEKLIQLNKLTHPVIRQKVSDEIEEYNKKITEVKKKVEDILDPKAEVTKADVVVLTAITNIVFNEEIADSILAMKDAENEDDEKKAADAFQSATINEAMKLLDVVAYVPSDMASGILGVLDSFMTSSGK